jgi:hypothetical protein
MIRGVPDWEAECRWSEIRPLLQKGIDRGRGEWEPEDVLEKLRTKEYQLWAGGEPFEVVACTTVVQYPRLKICEIILAGGKNLELCREGKETIKEWAKSIGCQEIRGGGRRGWLKILGWPHIYTICGERL